MVGLSRASRELLRAAVESSKAADRLLRAALNHAFPAHGAAGEDIERLARETAALRAQVSPHHLTFPVQRRLETRKLGTARSISFRTKIQEKSGARQMDGIFHPSWRLDIKNHAYDFVDAIGVRRPLSDKKRYSFEDAPKDAPGVLKATRSTGSRGCYLLYSHDHIEHVLDGQTFDSLESMAQHAQELMSHPTRPMRNNWMWEELILEDVVAHRPARDLKFYAFYGEVVIMRESARVDGELKVAFWDADSVRQEMGHKQHYDFDSVGFTPEEAALVSQISLQIPHPFLRIDMLKGEEGLVLGEFTPRPGFFDAFNDKWDRILGEAWVRAESRLMVDLLRGKSFQPFLESTGALESH